LSEIFASILIVIGAAFVLIGSFGLLRFPDFFTRLHAPTKATTLGLAALLGASVAYTAGTEGGISVREFLITFFLFITAPVSAHVLARAAIRRRLHSLARLPEMPARAEKTGE